MSSVTDGLDESEDRSSSVPHVLVQLSRCTTLLTSVLASYNNEEVHGTNFSEPVLFTEEPEVLLESFGGCFHLRLDAWRIVGSKLVLAYSPWPCSNFAGVSLQ